MARIAVRHVCGHMETHIVYAPAREHHSYEQRFAGRRCSVCEADEWRRMRMHDNAASALLAEIEGLPALHGTVKQVGWAETIRRDALSKIAAVWSECERGLRRQVEDEIIGPGAINAARAAVDRFRADILGNTRARWWIDRRHILTDRYRMTTLLAPVVRDAVLPHHRVARS